MVEYNHDIKNSLTSSNLFATTSTPSRLSPFLKTSTRCFGFSNNDFIRFESVFFFVLDLSSGSSIPVIVQDDAKRVRSLSVKTQTTQVVIEIMANRVMVMIDDEDDDDVCGDGDG